MPVNLSEPNNLLAVDGVELAVAASEMRYKDRDDLLLIRLAEGSKTAAVFTLNKFCAAPVHLAKKQALVSKVIKMPLHPVIRSLIS